MWYSVREPKLTNTLGIRRKMDIQVVDTGMHLVKGEATLQSPLVDAAVGTSQHSEPPKVSPKGQRPVSIHLLCTTCYL